MKFKDSYHFYAGITILFWALAPVFTRLSLQYYSPMELGFLRYLIASVLLLLVILITKTSLPRKQDIGWFIASALTGFTLFMVFFNTGLQYTESATTSVILATAPIMTALLASIILKEKLLWQQWVAIAIEFLGIIVLTVAGKSVTLNQGVFWLLCAAIVLSIYNLIQRRLTRTYTSFQVAAYSILIGTVFLSVFAPKGGQELAHAPLNQWINLLILAIFTSAIAYITWTIAFEKAEKTSQVSNYMFFSPLISGLLGFLLNNEVPGRSTIWGGILILTGMILFNRAKARAE